MRTARMDEALSLRPVELACPGDRPESIPGLAFRTGRRNMTHTKMTRNNVRSFHPGLLSWAGALTLAMLSAPFLGSCATLVAPFDTPSEQYRGFKARTFVGTAEEVRPIVIRTLEGMGYDVHSGGDDVAFVSATQGMAVQEPEVPGGRRTWIRVGVEVRQVDMHRRAPRTLVEVEAENVQGTSEGPINASFGAVPSSFYKGFFDQVDAAVTISRPRVVRGFMPPR